MSVYTVYRTWDSTGSGPVVYNKTENRIDAVKFLENCEQNLIAHGRKYEILLVVEGTRLDHKKRFQFTLEEIGNEALVE